MDPRQAFEQLSTPEGRANPYPVYELLRAHGDLVPLGAGRLVALGHRECVAAMRAQRLEVPDAKVYDLVYPGWRSHAAIRRFADSLLFTNQPAHGRVRTTLSGAFSPSRLSTLRPAVEGMVDRLLDRFADLGADGSAVEVVEEFAARLPVAVISDLLGFPEQDEKWFRTVASAIAVATDGFTDLTALRAANTAMLELDAYLRELIDAHRRDPADDLVSRMIMIHDRDGERLRRDELLGNLMLLLSAGFETTAFLVAHGISFALQFPVYADRLRTEPDFAAGYVEEVLRFEPPVQMTSRWCPVDLDLAGYQVPARTKFILLLGAANRDPKRYENPNRFDPDRRTGQPVSFGGGAHFCLGAALARMEAKIALPRFLRRFPRAELAGALTYRNRVVLRGLETLPVTL